MPDDYFRTPPLDEDAPPPVNAAYQGTADYQRTPSPESGTLPFDDKSPQEILEPLPPLDSIESVFSERGYRIVAKLGEGSYGSVFKAYNKDRVLVAIKVMKSCSSDDLTRYRQEARFLAQAEGSLGVVGLKADALDEPQYPYFVMQYAVGGPLSKQLGRLKLRKLVRIFRRVVETIHYVHSEQKAEGGREAKPRFIHCDLKPDNILLNAADEPLVADFGLAQLDRTRIRALGSLFYMAPEQSFVNVTPDPRWDVYALGAILYALVVGHAPREDASAGERIFKSMQRDPLAGRAAYREYLNNCPRPEEHWKHVDRRLAEIIDGCIELDPDKRIVSTDEILSLLKRRDEWLPHRIIPVTVDFESDRITEKTLADQLQHGALKPELSMRIFRQIVEAVQRTHARGIRHEDLRPENIFFRVPHEGDDSSLAAPRFGGGTSIESPALGSMPSARVSLGFSANQVGFVSPELMKDREPSALEATVRRRAELPVEVRLDDRKFRGDIYSLGALLYAMVIGKPPLYPEDLSEKLRQEASLREWKRIYTEKVVHAEAIETLKKTDFDRELEDLVTGCLSPDPAKRPKSTTALLEQIDRRSHWRRNRKSFQQLCWIALFSLLGLAGVCYAFCVHSVEGAKDQRYRQTLQAHEEYLGIAELALQNQVAEAVTHLQSLKAQLETDAIGGRLAKFQESLQNDPDYKNLDGAQAMTDAIRRRQLDEPRQFLTKWLNDRYPPELFQFDSLIPCGIQLLAKRQGSWDSYSIGRVDWEPTETENDKNNKEARRFVIPLGAINRNYSYRSYIHGGVDLGKSHRPQSLIDKYEISNVYQTYLGEEQYYQAKHHWMMDISALIEFRGQPVAVLCVPVFVEIAGRASSDIKANPPRAFLDYWFDKSKENFRQIAIINEDNYPVRLPQRGDDDDNWRYLTPYHCNQQHDCDESWKFLADSPKGIRRFPDLQTDDQKRILEAGLAAGYYFEPHAPDTEYLAVIKPITIKLPNDKTLTWTMICTTTKDKAMKPIREAAWKLFYLSLFLWLAIATILGLILFYLYRQLRYGESLRETLRALTRRTR